MDICPTLKMQCHKLAHCLLQRSVSPSAWMSCYMVGQAQLSSSSEEDSQSCMISFHCIQAWIFCPGKILQKGHSMPCLTCVVLPYSGHPYTVITPTACNETNLNLHFSPSIFLSLLLEDAYYGEGTPMTTSNFTCARIEISFKLICTRNMIIIHLRVSTSVILISL